MYLILKTTDWKGETMFKKEAKELIIKNVTDGKSKYFSWGFYKGCLVGFEYNKQIAELEIDEYGKL